MEFFIDTANIEEIRKLNEMGLVDGVTTNPTLIKKAGKDHEKTIKEISSFIKGPISVESLSDDAKARCAINNRILPELPEGYVLPDNFRPQQARRSMTDSNFANAFFRANK